MVAVLLAAAGVPAGRLEVAVGLGADPDVGPGRRDGELPDPFQDLGLADGLAVGIGVGEAFPLGPPPDARRVIGDVAQARGLRTFDGIDEDGDGET
jgi:hypothetical protein